MEADFDAPAILASLIVLGVLLSSAALWILHIQKPREVISPDLGIRAWSIGWVNFGIFLCALVVAVAFANIVAGAFLGGAIEEANGELTPWLAVFGVLLLQLPLIAVFFLVRRISPGNFADRLSSRDIGFMEAFRITLPYFLRTLPLVWVASIVWGQVLQLMHAIGLIEEYNPQELVTLFAADGDPLAIGLLVLFAVVLAPLVEEIIFRGCLYRFLKSQTALLPAQIISGIFFALLHANLLSFVPLVLVGLLLARVYEASGNLLTAVIYHAFFNGFTLLMLFLFNHSSLAGN